MLEMLHAQFQFIGIEQLVGVLKVATCWPWNRTDPAQEYPGTTWNSCGRNWKLSTRPCRTWTLNKVRLRRRIRAMLGKGDHLHEEKIVHRNDECRLAFKRAEKEATGNDGLTSQADSSAHGHS